MLGKRELLRYVFRPFSWVLLGSYEGSRLPAEGCCRRASVLPLWETARRLPAVILASLPLLVAPVSIEAQEIRIRVGHFPNMTHVQALVARHLDRQDHNRFSASVGPHIKIEWYAYNAGPSAMEAIFAESLDLTYVGPNPALNAYARSRGEEVRVIAGAVQGGSALVVQPDRGLARGEDFRGKRIATPQFGNTQDVAARAWLAAAGLRITQTGGDAHVVPTQNPDQLALFHSKQIDAVWTIEPWVSRLELEAGGKVILEETDAITTILVSSTRFLREHRQLARRFVVAHAELTDWINANPAEAQRMLREELRAAFRLEVSSELIARAWSRMTVTSAVNREAFQAFVANAQRVGFLRDMPDLNRFVEAP